MTATRDELTTRHGVAGDDATFEGEAIVYCEGAFGTANGKTAHGLVRRSRRYRVLAVIDSTAAGGDAGELLDGRPAGIPLCADLEQALATARVAGRTPTHLVVGLAPDGGRLPPSARAVLREALAGPGLNLVAGLHDLLGDDPELVALAARRGLSLLDVRRPPERAALHFFSGAIEQVRGCLRVALLGTDSAIGKRTTAWVLVDALQAAGHRAELVGTGQTAWLQGARHGIVLDALVNDFVAGEIEHAVVRCHREARPEVIVIEGQGSLMNPAYPGGFEILAAARPDVVVLQHAPRRRDYDGFDGYPVHPLEQQIGAIELISGKPVVAITINHEGIAADETAAVCAEISAQTGLLTCDVLRQGPGALVAALAGPLRDRLDRERAR